jgi:hypothetical protein
MAPTHEDAQLMVQLAQWATSLGIQDAMPKLWADDFDPETADAMADGDLRTLLTFGETLGTLAKHNLFDTGLAHDWIALSLIWERLAPAVGKLREQMGEDRMYENFEALATQT